MSDSNTTPQPFPTQQDSAEVMLRDMQLRNGGTLDRGVDGQLRLRYPVEPPTE